MEASRLANAYRIAVTPPRFISTACLYVPLSGRAGWAARHHKGKPLVIAGRTVALQELANLSPHIVSHQARELNARAREGCVADSSLATYTSAWNAWTRCADFYGFDIWCMDAPMEPMSVEHCTQLLDLFIGFECGLRQMSPASIRQTYLPGIAKVFDIRKVFNRFRCAANHTVTKCLLDGYERQWFKKHPAHQRAKIPFTMTLALEAERALSSGVILLPGLHTQGHSVAAFMERTRCVCALFFGIFFLLRKSEFLPKSSTTSQHTPMRRSHLRFMTSGQTEIPYDQIGFARASWITITVQFSKTDQTGRGRIVTHFVDVDHPTQCIVQRMEAYIQMSRDGFHARASDLLFHVPSLRSFGAESLATLMRATCKTVGLPDDKVSAHSLRYGGATTLAAAGLPEYIIAFYGGWAPNSSAMRRYIKPSNETSKLVSRHMSRSQSSVAVQAAVNQILAYRVPDTFVSR